MHASGKIEFMLWPHAGWPSRLWWFPHCVCIESMRLQPRAFTIKTVFILSFYVPSVLLLQKCMQCLV